MGMLFPLQQICGIGNVTEQHLKSLGITQCGELRSQFGLIHLLFSDICSSHLLQVSLGLGQTDLTDMASSDRKSISVETTFSGTQDKQQFLDIIKSLCQELHNDMKKKNIHGKLFTLKMKTVDFSLRTRSQSLPEPTIDIEVMMKASKRILQYEMDKCLPGKHLNLRLLGVRMSTLLDVSDTSSKQITISQMLPRIASSSSYDNPSSIKTGSSTYEHEHSTKFNSLLKTSQKTKYICPICDNEIPTKYLKAFNTHIDECLFKTANSSETVTSNLSTDDTDILGISALSEVGECSAPTATMGINGSPEEGACSAPTATIGINGSPEEGACSAPTATMSIYGPPEERVSGGMTCSNHAEKLSEGAECSLLRCPVCSDALFSCPVALNTHLDECLSRRHLLHNSPTTPTNTKRKISFTNKTDKKRKKSNYITNYFS